MVTELVRKAIEVAQGMTYAELRTLNGYVVESINSMNRMRAATAKANVRLNMRVTVAERMCTGRATKLLGKVGVVVKLARTKASVVFGSDGTWNVPYTALEEVTDKVGVSNEHRKAQQKDTTAEA